MNMNELQALVVQLQAGTAPIPETIEMGDVVIDTNHGHYILTEATWEPYKRRSEWNKDGLNGFVTGKVQSGGDTNRLFHVTSFTDYAGKIKEFGYCYLPRAYARGGDGSKAIYFNLQFCG